MSQFLKDNRSYHDETFRKEIDFEDAIKLPNGGSTCDIYRTRWQRREVFVKRLKKEHRTNPLYLDAMDKEYDIGVSLKHPSLPDYREFHRDYIVMDFIDGTTLADMITKQDSWLKNEKNIVRMMKELVEVTDYLHRHNVTHCDIKPDNIIITANNKNLILIDLDKCYTDFLNDSSGDPSKYGLTPEEQGKITLDFHGIGRVVEKLKERVKGFRFRKYKEFIKECYDKDCNSDRLLEILDYKSSQTGKKKYLLAGLLAIGIIGFILLWKLGEFENKIPEESVVETETIILKDTIIKTAQQKETKPSSIEKPPVSHTTPTMVHTKEQLHEEAQEMAAQLDKIIQPYYNRLNVSLDHLEELKSNPELSKEQLLDSVRKHGDLEDEYISETFEVIKETFPGISERETWRVLAYSKAYTGYKRRAGPVLKNYFN